MDMNKKQCPCQDPESDEFCSACEEQVVSTGPDSYTFVYVEMPDGTVSGCADECPCNDTGFVDNE